TVKLEITNSDFEGDYTFVVFPLLRFSKKKPEETAEDIGNKLLDMNLPLAGFNVVKGFLNLVIQSDFWAAFLQQEWKNAQFGAGDKKSQKVMVEYSSPNTNKPLHLGHIRNILLGYSLAEIMNASGYDVTKANLINDRGIHICKSMLAWKLFGGGETPEKSGLKGDHLVGKYYVEFDKKYKAQIAERIQNGIEEKEAEKEAPLLKDAQQMLLQWEAGEPDTIELWKTMNGWVYEGFDKSYQRLGVDFDKFYYESDTYKLGKDLIQEGLEKGVFYTKDDGSIWINLTDDGLDEKLVLRKDGTSVYITQDIGTADKKAEEFNLDKSIYVVGNEQDYHFKVLFLIMKKLGRKYADGMYHLSYGMVDLPSGKMKSREGTVVDADDLMDEMYSTAKAKTMELGKTENLSAVELEKLYENLGLAALKFYILKVDPKKRMLFNPEDSIDFQGDTGPFVLYTNARIQSILKQAGDSWKEETAVAELHVFEKNVLEVLYRYPSELEAACKSYSPAVMCHYLLELAKAFNRLYNELPMLKETDLGKKSNRLKIAAFTSSTIKSGLRLLGIQAVDRM
ncbi:MAG: arginine--tRNA ligase, partial [Bacteroidia bacterium]|nr:arginine--tRNA ligase [Bacteroidia bacterium]